MEKIKKIVIGINRYDLVTGFIDYNQYDEETIYLNIQKLNKENLKTTRERITYLIHQLSWQIYMIDHIEELKILNPKKIQNKKKMQKIFKDFLAEKICQSEA